jgi:hypothetical protein
MNEVLFLSDQSKLVWINEMTIKELFKLPISEGT